MTAVAIVGGRSGDWIVDRLAALAMDVRAIRSAAETRTCVSILDRSTGALTEVYEPGAAIQPADWEALEAADRDGARARRPGGGRDLGQPAAGGAVRRLRPDRPDRAGRSARPVPLLADTYGPALAAVLVERPASVKVNATEAGEATGVGGHRCPLRGDRGGGPARRRARRP